MKTISSSHKRVRFNAPNLTEVREQTLKRVCVASLHLKAFLSAVFLNKRWKKTIYMLKISGNYLSALS